MDELISIVTTLYNYKKYISDLIRSVKNQTYMNWELIIVDDGSTDNPYEVIDTFWRISPVQIRYFRFDENRGYAVAKNKGIVHTKGKYIVMIDADDELTPNSLRIRKEVLDANPDRLWCHGEVLVRDEGKTGLDERSRNWKRKFRKQLADKNVDLKTTYHHRLIHAQSVMVRPELHKKYGLYDPTLRFSADNEMWRRLIRFGEVPAHIEDFVAIYRVHPNRMATSHYKRMRVQQIKKRIINDVERRFHEGINSSNTQLWG